MRKREENQKVPNLKIEQRKEAEKSGTLRTAFWRFKGFIIIEFFGIDIGNHSVAPGKDEIAIEDVMAAQKLMRAEHRMDFGGRNALFLAEGIWVRRCAVDEKRGNHGGNFFFVWDFIRGHYHKIGFDIVPGNLERIVFVGGLEFAWSIADLDTGGSSVAVHHKQARRSQE